MDLEHPVKRLELPVVTAHEVTREMRRQRNAALPQVNKDIHRHVVTPQRHAHLKPGPAAAMLMVVIL